MVRVIVVQHSTGRGIRGLVRYVLSDKASAGSDEHPTTSERVLWADTLGLPGIDPELMVRIMQGVTADQKLIKQRAGTSNRGRKLRDPYVHLSMNYGPGPRPSREQVMADSRSMVAAIGMGERYYFIVVGHDDPHNSYHVIGCRIDPETGKAAKLAHSGLKLSTWAEQWEREHGGIRVLNRVKRRKVRERNARVLEECKSEGREPELGELRAQAPMAPRRGRDHRGRSVRRTHEESREFTELQNRHRQEKTPQGQSRAERFELHVRHVVARGEKVIGNGPIEQPEVPEPVDVPRRPAGPEPLMDFEPSVQEPPPVEVPARPRQAEPVLEITPVQVPPAVRVPVRPRSPEPVLEVAPASVPPPVEVPARPRQAEPVLEITPVQVPPAVRVPVRPRSSEPVLEVAPASVPPPVEVPARPRQAEPVLESTPVEVPSAVGVRVRPRQPEPLLDIGPAEVPTTPPTARPTLPVPASTPKTPVQPPATPAEAALQSRDLIQALGKPRALRALRRRFQGMDPQRDLKPLVVEIIDPQLLRVALGPDLASRWAPGLEKVYATIRERHPARFNDIDEVWHRQREFWHGLLRGKKRSSSPEPGAHFNIARDQHHEHAHGVELERRPDESDVRPVPTVAAAAPVVESPAAPAEERRLAGEHRQLNVDVAQLEHGTGAAASDVEPQPATTTHDEATAAPGHREASPPPTAVPTPEPAAVTVTKPERVRLAVDAVKAILPRTQPYSGNPSHRPPAVSDERFDRLAAAAKDEFAREVIAEIQRQHYYTDFQRRESEKTHLRAVIARKNRENLSAYEQSEAERKFFSRRLPKPTWAEAETVVIQEFETELLGAIEDACRKIRQRSSAGVRLEPQGLEPDRVSTYQRGRSPSGTQQPDRGHPGPSR